MQIIVNNSFSGIFNFSIFITGLALLVVMYTITDIAFKFRVAVFRLPLMKISYLIIIILGIVLLSTDFIFSENIGISNYIGDQLIWQVISGSVFFGLACWWLWVGFMKHSQYLKNNYDKFFNTIYHFVLKNNISELSVIAYEIYPSIKNIILSTKKISGCGRVVMLKHKPFFYKKDTIYLLNGIDDKLSSIWFSNGVRVKHQISSENTSFLLNLADELNEGMNSQDGRFLLVREMCEYNTPNTPNIADYSNELINLISNKIFCKAIVDNSAVTAIVFMEEMKKNEIYPPMAATFVNNITLLSLLNTDSLIYHENNRLHSGTIGQQKRLSNAICDNYGALIEVYVNNPLILFDIHYETREKFSSLQWEAYCRLLLLVFKAYVRLEDYKNPYILSRGTENLESAYSRSLLHKDETETSSKLFCVTSFIRNVLENFNEARYLYDVKDAKRAKNIYAILADLAFMICQHFSGQKIKPLSSDFHILPAINNH